MATLQEIVKYTKLILKNCSLEKEDRRQFATSDLPVRNTH